MYKIKENKQGHFLIVYEDKFLWWKRYYFLCSKKIKNPQMPTQAECEHAYFSASKSSFNLDDRLYFNTLEQAQQAFSWWHRAHELKQKREEENIAEHTIKDHGKEIELS